MTDKFDNALIYHNCVPKLIEMASFRVALDLWHYCNIDGALRKERGFYSIHCSDHKVRKLLASLKSQNDSLVESIESLVCSIARKVRDWVAYHRQYAFYRHEDDDVASEFFPKLIWQPNGAIDYEKTAMKLARDEKLDDIERYRLMCEYCLEDDIRAMWSRLRNENKLEDVEFEKHPLMGYWNCLLANDFDKVPDNDLISIENRMPGYLRNFTSIEYFFNRCETEKKVYFGIRVLEARDSVEFIKFLAQKFDEVGQREVLTSIMVQGVMSFALSPFSKQCAITTWNFVKTFATEEQYINLLWEMIELWKSMCEEDYNFVEVTGVLINLWNATPDNLKQIGIRYDNGVFLCDLFACSCFDDMFIIRQRFDGLLVRMLADSEPEFRRKLWCEKWPSILYGSRPRYFREIMQVCLDNDSKKMEEFAKDVANNEAIRVYLVDLLRYGMFVDVSEFLKIFTSNENQKKEFRKELLKTIEDMSSSIFNWKTDDEYINSVSEFIRDAFGDKLQAADALKEKMMLSCFNNELFGFFSHKVLEEKIYLTESLCGEERLSSIKAEVLQRYELYLRNTPSKGSVDNCPK